MSKVVHKDGVLTPAAALALAMRAMTCESVRREGVVLTGSIDDMAMLYQAARHAGLKVAGIELNGKQSALTYEVTHKRELDWKAFLADSKKQNRWVPPPAALLRKALGEIARRGNTPEQAPALPPAPASGDPLSRLDSLIGLEGVKAQVRDVAAFMKVRAMRERAGLPLIDMGQHMVFTGNPGTGKTTVARIVGDIYRELGVLRKGHFTETDGRGLIAEYVGQTAEKVRQIVTEALDGVLFIDEAYALVPQDSFRDFGPEAVMTLLKMMEDHRDRLIVIIAGYEDEMERLLATNPGLKSRFKTRVDFPDYTGSELALIFEQLCRDGSYILDEAVKQKAVRLFSEMYADRGMHFGNGRAVRNAFERCVTNQARRLAEMKNPGKRDLQTLVASDIPDLSGLLC